MPSRRHRRCRPRRRRLLHLPDVEQLPVVFAVRMSLSFPLLLSAVPLWAVDYGGTDQAEPVWFSGGGITSNLPVHFFDALLPTRPTFAINLGPGENLDPPISGRTSSSRPGPLRGSCPGGRTSTA